MPHDWKSEAREISSEPDLEVDHHRVQVYRIQGKDWRY